MYAPRITLFRFGARLQRFLQQRFTVAGRILVGGTLAALLFGIDIRQSQSLQVASLMAGILSAACLWLLRRKLRIRVQRRLPAFATVDTAFSYALHIEREQGSASRLSDWSADCSIVEELDTTLPTASDYLAFAETPGLDSRLDRLVGFRRWLRLLRHHRGGIVEAVLSEPAMSSDGVQAQVRLLPLRRGYLQFASTKLLRPDPLGLLNAISVATTPESLLVLPRRLRVPRIDFPNARRHQPGGLHLASHVGDSEEFLSLREYASGDAIRRIHWRSWARTGRPIVKQFQDEFLSRQALVFDTFGASGAVFETGVSLAASFVVSPQPVDTVIDLVFMGERAVTAQAGRSLGSQRGMLELLACAQPAPAQQGGFESLSRCVLKMAPRISAAVLVLLAWDEARQALVQALRAQYIAVAVVVVSGETIPPAALGPMRDTAEMFWAIDPDNPERDLASVAARPATQVRAAMERRT